MLDIADRTRSNKDVVDLIGASFFACKFTFLNITGKNDLNQLFKFNNYINSIAFFYEFD
jgi:hypothetical protein